MNKEEHFTKDEKEHLSKQIDELVSQVSKMKDDNERILFLKSPTRNL